jgi:hypothetical protein
MSRVGGLKARLPKESDSVQTQGSFLIIKELERIPCTEKETISLRPSAGLCVSLLRNGIDVAQSLRKSLKVTHGVTAHTIHPMNSLSIVWFKMISAMDVTGVCLRIMNKKHSVMWGVANAVTFWKTKSERAAGAKPPETGRRISSLESSSALP